MRNLESTRRGRVFQCFGVFWIAYGIADAVWIRLDGQPLWITLINAITITGGFYTMLGPGRRMVNTAREHKAFMDNHRRVMANFDQRRKAMWS